VDDVPNIYDKIVIVTGANTALGYEMVKVRTPLHAHINYKACGILYHSDRKFTDSENLLAEMADKFSFEFW
jgi:hypothetical protein